MQLCLMSYELPDSFFEANNKQDIFVIKSPLHLQCYLDEVFPPISDETIDIVYRTVFWFAYMGIPQKSIYKITEQMINFENMVIYLDDSIYQIYLESLPTLRACIRANRFVTNSGQKRYFPRTEEPSVLRGRIQQGDAKTVIDRLSRRLDELRKKNPQIHSLVYKDVFNYGWYYMIYNHELAGLDVKEWFSVMAEKTCDTGVRGTKPFVDRRRFIKKDYEAWKRIVTGR